MTTLQIVWFLLIGVLLTGYAVLDGFDLGVGFWHLSARKPEHRHLLLRAIGPVWDGNEVWLLTGGGALFAAFPPVYATVFSGLYLPLILVLFALMFRAVAIEFHHKVDSDTWRRRWDVAFAAGSVVPALLFGVALGNIVRGLTLNAVGDYTGGFFALLNPYALLVGVTGLAMFATHGALFIVVKTEGELAASARAWAAKAWRVYLVLLVASTAWSLASFQRGSIVLPAAAGGVALAAAVLAGICNKAGADVRAFLASATGIVALMGAVGATLFPDLVPASNGAARSLTIFDSSSSRVTLTTMLYVAVIGMPIVIGYTVFIYRTFAGKVTAAGNGY